MAASLQQGPSLVCAHTYNMHTVDVGMWVGSQRMLGMGSTSIGFFFCKHTTGRATADASVPALAALRSKA
jgi:hypothetical protein